MSLGFLILTIVFIIVSTVMVLIILVQRPQGGGLAGAFGGASGGSTDTVFGGRVGDALTVMTVVAFSAYLLLAIGLNVMDPEPSAAVAATQPAVISGDGSSIPVTPVDPGTAPTETPGATLGGQPLELTPVDPSQLPPGLDPNPPGPIVPPQGQPQTPPAGEPGAAPADPPVSPPATTGPGTAPGR